MVNEDISKQIKTESKKKIIEEIDEVVKDLDRLFFL